MAQPTRIVTDTMAGLTLPDFDIWSDWVSTVLGQNPSAFTGPGTNTYLVGKGKKPILLDTGIGLDVYDPLLKQGLAETKNGATELQEIVITHVHQDHIGGVAPNQNRSASKPVRQISSKWRNHEPRGHGGKGDNTYAGCGAGDI